MENFELILFFFGIAVLYSSVGFGGGSSYLAILTLAGIDYLTLRAVALLCNITVVTFGTFIFWKNGHLDWRKVLPLAVVSVPLAYLGGQMRISERTFFILLGFALLSAGLLMFFQKKLKAKKEGEMTKKSLPLNAGLGGGIGFLSGMVGIGGGIFLAPVLHLLRWDTAKVIAATASCFILVNSIAGLVGQMTNPALAIDWQFAGMLMASVFLGGQIGSRLAASRFRQDVVRLLTAALVVFVAARILWKYLF